MKLAVVSEVITNEQVQAAVAAMQEGKTSKGACIRTLFAGGLEVKEIATLTGIRYNHVYNVVKNEVLVHGLEVETSSRSNANSKKNKILEMLEQGMTVTEISKELKCMYKVYTEIQAFLKTTTEKGGMNAPNEPDVMGQWIEVLNRQQFLLEHTYAVLDKEMEETQRLLNQIVQL